MKRTPGIGDWVFLCHHEIPFERLTEPMQDRIDYIKAHKPENEQEIRLKWFTPVPLSAIPKKVRDESNRLWAECNRIWAESSQIWAEGNRIWDESNRLVTPYLEAAFQKHIIDAGCPWDAENSTLIFPKVKG